mmetsp:Transcript_52029/g.71420  ORF Transcript_52029/g.71420 Transcript_52029/m.71420 type:complete len:236 (+) Transcript_52029:15-722(+)
MSRNIVFARAFRLQKAITNPLVQQQAARIGVTNRYRWDYACEDEYFEREMTLLEARELPLPLPSDFKHADPPNHEIWPAHWNDVRFNFKPQNIDRRAYIHDNYMNFYNFKEDFMHTTGFVDEDLDYEVTDPADAMHFKKKRSQPITILGAFIAVGILFGYPICGLKIPQKDNPFYYRKKYASETFIRNFQGLAMHEYGSIADKQVDTNCMFTHKGFEQVGEGIRFELDNYNDLIC